ncbi:PBSX family phage terminase large subunit [Companilactobacillus ginsenosidimutans]|uniref:PBSX family phage terminase, large subunit n=1 Tax=Companilactobacillus ginsenosidimutans TaxID=1007676 RepID=A0A0H4QHK2_9LACO|nr:PBSX family phage terminase large subunit [Companilactobacillus ginsenosidimutans]AKP66133.1 PBSX family phage terminase, large subunit [Companilactobacillus ginsenosidimutans]AKP68341.1 PBSX family phage terminase, large subunit [Companilactobacillus ginsenosidimutans]
MTIDIKFMHPEKEFNRSVFDSLNDYEHFTEVWYGGAASGKSHGVVQKVVLKALKEWKHPRKVLFLRKVGSRLRDSIYEDVVIRLSEWKLLPYCKINKTNFEITLPNGAMFLFKGMDDQEKIKSIKGLSDVVMEEATEFSQEDYEQLTLRVRERKHSNKQIFLMFNPVSKANWVYQYFFKNKQPDTIIHQSSYKDNKFVDDQTRRNIEKFKTTNPVWYRIYALGEFATLDKLIFPNYEVRRLNSDSPELQSVPSMFGLDFGYTNDPSFFIHVKVDDKNKKMYFIEEYSKTGMMNNQIADVIKSMGYSKEVITADAAEPKSIDELRRNGIERVRKSNKGKDSIIQGIQFMQQYELIVDDRCQKVIEGLENYTWQKDKKTGEYTNKPVDLFNHWADATRYAVEEINGKGKVQAKVHRNLLF